jgi:hypothetical protein
MMGTLRNLFEWAVLKGRVGLTAFKRNGIVAVRLRLHKEVRRTRRLDTDAKEEDRRLAAAQPHTREPDRWCPPAAAASCCRYSGGRSGRKGGVMHHLDLPADKTKTTDPRKVPITPRLRAILEYPRTGPDGREHGPDQYVFGNEVGERVGRVYTA